MLTTDQVRALALATVHPDPARRERALANLGAPSDDALVEGALAALGSDDRNARVAALRELARHATDAAADGVVRAMHDPARRVRLAAIKSTTVHGARPQVVARLREIVEDEREKPKIRRNAWFFLGVALRAEHRAPEVAMEVLRDLVQHDAYRGQVLFLLLRADRLTDEISSLLRGFVRTGSKEEAVAATRALCGYRVVNIGDLPAGERAAVERDGEVAAGSVWYWVPRPTDEPG